jgi:hypothetical protein
MIQKLDCTGSKRLIADPKYPPPLQHPSREPQSANPYCKTRPAPGKAADYAEVKRNVPKTPMLPTTKTPNRSPPKPSISSKAQFKHIKAKDIGMETIVFDDDFAQTTNLRLVPAADRSSNPSAPKAAEEQRRRERKKDKRQPMDEQSKEWIGVRSMMLMSASQTKAHSGKARSKVAEDTDLDNNDPEEPIHIFTPPQSPLAKVAYFSQTISETYLYFIGI